MAVELRALRPSFAAEVDGIDLSQPMDAGNVRTIWDAIDRYAVLLFRDQRLTDTQLRDFAAEFGPLEIAACDDVGYQLDARAGGVSVISSWFSRRQAP